MRNFIAGCVFGLILSGIAFAAAPRIVGDSGYAGENVRVKYRGGEVICTAPWVWMEPGGGATIECPRR